MKNHSTNIFYSYAIALIPMIISTHTAFAKEEKKLNVCTITINSDNEREVFKKHLNPKYYNHIELTDFATETEKTTKQEDKSKWFMRACESGIQCDELVISGHFSNGFFNSDVKAKLALPMDAITKYSCNRTCDGILKKPLETFLSGCNTLAVKGEDFRSPEELYNQLITEDYYSTEEASAAVSVLYSKFGEDSRTKFQKIFSNTPRIYGFSNRSPSGPHLESRLEQYLSNANKSGYFTPAKLTHLDNKLNSLFLNAMQGTAFIQLPGKKEELALCLLTDSKTSIQNRLLWIEKNLKSETPLSSVNEILDFFKHQIPDQKSLTANELEILNRIRLQKTAEAKFREFINNDIDDILINDSVQILNLKAQLRVSELMLKLNWMSSNEYHQFLTDRLLGKLETPITERQHDQVCTMNVQLDVDPQSIPNARWYEDKFYLILGCLNPQNLEMQMTLANLMTKVPRRLIFAIGWSIGSLENKLPELIAALAKNLSNPNPLIRISAAVALRSTKNIPNQVINDLITIAEDNKNIIHLRLAAVDTLATLKINNKQIFKRLSKLIESNQPAEVRYSAIQALGNFENLDLESIIGLVYQLEDSDAQIRLLTLRAFEKILPDDDFAKKRIASCIEDTDQSVARTAKDVINALSKKYKKQ
jgi:hypothetical protein